MSRVCSNCGAACGVDSRMGSVDHYLVCNCASAANTRWINDGRGGYDVYLNGATPVTVEEYARKNQKSNSNSTRSVAQDWSREDD